MQIASSLKQSELNVDVKPDQGGSNAAGDRIQKSYQVSSVTQIVVWLHDGDDNYSGGFNAGAGVLISQFVFGGAGNDQIQGGSGRDILIGGLGKDTLHGDAGDDILIGGRAANENYLTALDQAIVDWGNGNLAATLLDLGVLIDDNTKDDLYGDLGNDYLFGGVDDKLKQ